MLEGRCRKCGNCVVGETLRFSRNQSCSTCGASLEIYQDGKKVSEGFSPFTAEKYSLNKHPNVPTAIDKIKDVSL